MRAGGGGAGCEVSPTSAPLTFRAEAGKRPLSWCQPRGRSVPYSGARPQAATAGLQPGLGGGVLSPQAPLCLALRTPPRPQIPAPAKGSSKQVRSFSPPDQPDAKKSATHMAEVLYPQVSCLNLLPGPPILSTSFLLGGPQEWAPNTCWGS